MTTRERVKTAMTAAEATWRASSDHTLASLMGCYADEFMAAMDEHVEAALGKERHAIADRIVEVIEATRKKFPAGSLSGHERDITEAVWRVLQTCVEAIRSRRSCDRCASDK